MFTNKRQSPEKGDSGRGGWRGRGGGQTFGRRRRPGVGMGDGWAGSGPSSARLERLVRVLETGATGEVRREAARQVGEVDAALAPVGPGPATSYAASGAVRGALLVRLRGLLRSEAWETRERARHLEPELAAARQVRASRERIGDSGANKIGAV